MKELLFSVTKKDLKIQYYKESGKGGQNRNKRETAVRIVHEPSGTTVIACDERTQGQNLKIAFRRLTENEKFKKWLHIEAARRMQNKKEVEEKINKEVDAWMKEENLKIETFIPEE
ncbi:MAG TPA: peptide chain release factor-like protein [Methanofastidiosum sp.]|nr:peptide chain release factor-like protein [Methanofastidiosum sp.]